VIKRHKKIDDKVLQAAIKMRVENSERSVAVILTCLEATGVVPKGYITRGALQAALAKNGFSSKQMRVYNPRKSDSGGRNFQRSHINELWQSDSKHSMYIGKIKTYLISFIDDKSRLILHSEFYFNETTESIMDCLRKAIAKYGVPKQIYLDNGTPYKAGSLGRACSLLGIKITHTKPYCAKSKGKVERYQQICNKFESEARIEKFATLEQVNDAWQKMLFAFYQDKAHSSLDPGVTPLQSFKDEAALIRYVSSEDLDNAFLMMSPARVVDRTGCVSLSGIKYTGDNLMLHIGKKAHMVWDPSNKSTMYIEIGNFKQIKARVLEIPEFLPKTDIGEQNPMFPKPKKSIVFETSRILYEKRQNSRVRTLFDNVPEHQQDWTSNEIMSKNPSTSASASASQTDSSMVSLSSEERTLVEELNSISPKRSALRFNQLDGLKSQPETSSDEIGGVVKRPKLSFNRLMKDIGGD
jgi:transposase InsO family protein